MALVDERRKNVKETENIWALIPYMRYMKETEKAVLFFYVPPIFETGNDQKAVECWVPKSQINFTAWSASRVFTVIKAWFANKLEVKPVYYVWEDDIKTMEKMKSFEQNFEENQKIEEAKYEKKKLERYVKVAREESLIKAQAWQELGAFRNFLREEKGKTKQEQEQEKKKGRAIQLAHDEEENEQ